MDNTIASRRGKSIYFGTGARIVDLKLLDNLKDQLVNSKELSKVYCYFLDHFGENAEFMELGGRVRHSRNPGLSVSRPRLDRDRTWRRV